MMATDRQNYVVVAPCCGIPCSLCPTGQAEGKLIVMWPCDEETSHFRDFYLCPDCAHDLAERLNGIGPQPEPEPRFHYDGVDGMGNPLFHEIKNEPKQSPTHPLIKKFLD